MKDANLLIWLTQLGISVAVPLVGFLLLALWLHQEWGFGRWIIAVGLIFGISGAVSGLRNSFLILNRMAKNGKEDGPPPVAFNEHD